MGNQASRETFAGKLSAVDNDDGRFRRVNIGGFADIQFGELACCTCK